MAVSKVTAELKAFHSREIREPESRLPGRLRPINKVYEPHRQRTQIHPERRKSVSPCSTFFRNLRRSGDTGPNRCRRAPVMNRSRNPTTRPPALANLTGSQRQAGGFMNTVIGASAPMKVRSVSFLQNAAAGTAHVSAHSGVCLLSGCQARVLVAEDNDVNQRLSPSCARMAS